MRGMESWTDERLDDLAAALRPLPAQVARNAEAIERLAGEMREMRGEMREMRADLAASHRQFAQIGWGLSFALTGALVALIVLGFA